MMIIRPATTNDLPSILELRRESYVSGNLRQWVGPFVEEHFRGIFEKALASPDSAWLLVADREGIVVGTSFGTLVPVWLAPGTSCASEAFIWVTPDARGQGAGTALLRSVEDWARDHGADFVSMSSFPTLSPAAMRKLCKSRGYEEFETNHMRRLH